MSGGPWLTVVGTLADGTLAPGASPDLLAGASAVYGSARLLEAAGVPADRRAPWPRPFADGIEAVCRRRGEPVTVLATGDPMHHGVGATLAARVPPEEMRVLPAPSAFALAAARLCWPLADVLCLSLHDRPVETLHRHLSPGRRILCLTRDGSTPAAVARLLVETGLGDSRLWVLEAMGTPRERIIAARADEGLPETDPLNVLAIAAAGQDGRGAAGRTVPGLPDGAYEHDGQITKADVRALTLAALAPLPGEHLWDVGAGSGSVAIEWCRAATGATATAFERSPARAALLARNARRLGTPEVALVEGDAADTLPARAERPDAVFLGGAVSDERVFEAAFAALRPGGRLLANAVTLEAEAALLARRARLGGALVRLSVEVAEPVGGFTAFAPKRPVVQWRLRKVAP